MNRKNLTTFALKVKQTILEHNLVPKEDGQKQEILVALSGGSDSVALFRALLELDIPIRAAHCNFGLRGQESERDEQFCRKLCQQFNIELYCKHFDTKNHAAQHKQSIEMAARQLRYDYFESLRNQHHLQSIAVAHHKNDQAETLLLNLIRGTGLKGLGGMAHKRDKIIRPLLDTSQEDILNYLEQIKQEFVEDSTNQIADVKRNIVRLRLIPLLKELNPNIIETLNRDAQHAAQAYKLLSALSPQPHWKQRADKCLVIKKSEISSRFVLNELLAEHNFSASQISNIFKQLNDTPGAIYHSPSSQLLRDREHLILRPNIQTTISPITFEPNTTVTYSISPLQKQTITSKLITRSELKTISRSPEIANLDADKIGEGELTLRPLQEGDIFQPLGMTGHKLVSDFLSDRKLDLFQKQSQMILLNKANQILWVVGEQIAHPFRISDDTKNVLVVESN